MFRGLYGPLAAVEGNALAEVRVRKHDIQEAKRPDAVLQSATSVFDWLLEHRTAVVGALVVVFVLTGAVSIAQSVRRSHTRDLGAKLGDALALDLRPVAAKKDDKDEEEPFATQADKDKAFQAALDKVAKENPGTPSGKAAALALASARFADGKYDEAIELAKGYVADPAGGTLNLFALETLGNAYAAKGDSANAEDTYKKLGDAGEPALALYLRGTLLEKNGKLDDAKKVFEQVVSDYEKDEAAKDARTHLDLIGMAPAGVGNLAAPPKPASDSKDEDGDEDGPAPALKAVPTVKVAPTVKVLPAGKQK